MTNEATAALETELRRQNAALIEFNTFITSLGDVELHVPSGFVEELDEIAKRCEPKNDATINGLRA